MDAQSQIRVGDAYRAMFAFIDAYWHRGGKRSDDIAVLLGSMEDIGREPAPRPLDVAQWHDWLAAVNKVTK